MVALQFKQLLVSFVDILLGKLTKELWKNMNVKLKRRTEKHGTAIKLKFAPLVLDLLLNPLSYQVNGWSSGLEI